MLNAALCATLAGSVTIEKGTSTLPRFLGPDTLKESAKASSPETDLPPSYDPPSYNEAMGSNDNHVASGNPDLFRGEDGNTEKYDFQGANHPDADESIELACYGFWAHEDECLRSDHSQPGPLELPCPQDMATCTNWSDCPEAPYLKQTKGEFVKKLHAIQAGVYINFQSGTAPSRYPGEKLPATNMRVSTYYSDVPYRNLSPDEGRQLEFIWDNDDMKDSSEFDMCWTGAYLEHYIQLHSHVPPKNFYNFVEKFDLTQLPDRREYYSEEAKARGDNFTNPYGR